VQYFLDTFTRFQRSAVIFCAVWIIGSSMLLWRM
jgi:hypothetical protein